MSLESSTVCPVCGSKPYEVFAELPGMPVHVGVLWDSPDAARASARGDITLAYCRCCGFIGNNSFDPSLVDYGLRYDNALHFSPAFKAYEQKTAERLIDRYGIRNRRVAEIGCGSGHFLSLICGLGKNRGMGFDPSYEPNGESLGEDVQILREYYSENHAEHMADLLCCRHVLEHIPEPTGFLDMVTRALGGDRDGIVYFGVPNAFLVFRDLSIWDVIYEHCNYFAGITLNSLFRSRGFEVLDQQEPYEGQFLSIEARLAPESVAAKTPQLDLDSDSLRMISGMVDAFAGRVSQKRNEWT